MRQWISETERRSKAQNVRLIIGVIIDRLEDAYEAALLSGISDVARERDVNLISFVGGWLCSPYGFEVQRNVVYDLVDAETVDGLVVVSNVVGAVVGLEETKNFCDRYRPLPMVSIGMALEGIPSVLVDNDKGMRDVIAHLIEAHGFRRIAFICGPEGNEEAEQRYGVYMEVLTGYGLPLDPDLIASGDFLAPSGAAAVRLLLDERKAAFEAIVAANDNMALGALEALQARGIRVPYEVALVGFDDIVDARAVTPSVTTVRQPTYEQGEQAADMLLALLAGEEVPKQVTLPTELVVRQSCGCSSSAVVQAATGQVERTGQAFEVALAAQRDHILSEIGKAMGILSAGLVPERAEQLLDAFSAELRGESPGTFLSTLEGILRQVAAKSDDVASWQGAISALRRNTLVYLGGDQALSRAEGLWHQARVMIGEVAQRVEARRRLQAERQAALLREIGQTLITTFDMEELMDLVARELPQLGIPSCYLSLYEQDTELVEGKTQALTEWARLVLAYDEKGRVELEAGGQVFSSRELMPGGMLRREGRYSMVVEPLYFREDQLGFALFEVGPQEGVIYEALSGQFSSALKGALLSQERKRAEGIIKRLAYHDSLTGLPNRRLFHDRLTLAMARVQRNQQKLALMLLDLDRFKDVNDTLGHSVGDRLLQVVGDRLTSLLRKSDTVARMGGDEFMLLLAEITQMESEATIAQKILEAIRKPFVFNGHELHITTSIGIALYPDDGEDADVLMKNVDIAMYRVKKEGRNNCQRYTPAMNAKALE